MAERYVRLRFRVGEAKGHEECLPRLLAFVFGGKAPRDVSTSAVRRLSEGGFLLRPSVAEVFAKQITEMWRKLPGHEEIAIEAILEDHDGVIPVHVGNNDLREMLDRMDEALDSEVPASRAVEEGDEPQIAELPPEIGRLILSALLTKRGRRGGGDDGGGGGGGLH